jgi:hypothetical protein
MTKSCFCFGMIMVEVGDDAVNEGPRGTVSYIAPIAVRTNTSRRSATKDSANYNWFSDLGAALL